MTLRFKTISLVNGGSPVFAPRIYSLATEDTKEDTIVDGYLVGMEDIFKANDVIILAYEINTLNAGAYQGYVVETEDGLSIVQGILDAPAPLSLVGAWNAATNTPTLSQPAPSGSKGDFYTVTAAGTALGFTWGIGDWCISDGTNWYRQANSSAGLALADGDIFIGDSDDIAQPITVSGDITLSNLGVAAISAGVIVNADINSAAGIVLSKLATTTSAYTVVANGSGVPTYVALTGDVTVTNAGVMAIAAGAIVDADINSAAAITISKLAAVTAGSLVMGNGSNVATVTAVTGDVTITSGGVTAIAAGVIVNADINGSAAIDASKIADGSVSSTEFQYINTLSSNAQTQLNALAPLASPTFTGTVTTAALTTVGTASVNASGAGVTTIGTGGTGAVNIGNATGNVAVTGNTSMTGNLTLAAAGNKINITAGANATVGTLTLNGATPVVTANTSVTTNSKIFLGVNTPAGVPAFSWVSAKINGTSFEVTGTAADTSVLNYWIIN